MKSENLSELPDNDLIKARLQPAESDAAKSSVASTPAGRVMLKADADRRACLAARGIELWTNEEFRDAGKVPSS